MAKTATNPSISFDSKAFGTGRSTETTCGARFDSVAATLQIGATRIWSTWINALHCIIYKLMCSTIIELEKTKPQTYQRANILIANIKRKKCELILCDIANATCWSIYTYINFITWIHNGPYTIYTGPLYNKLIVSVVGVEPTWNIAHST